MIDQNKAPALVAAAPGAPRTLHPGQVSLLVTVDRDGAEARVVYETRELIEAPNWTPDGRWLIYNSGGALFRIAADGSGAPQKIETGGLDANNDHVLSPDGRTIYISARDGHLHAVPIEGGAPRRVSNIHPPERPRRYYLHGVSPDNRTLAYVGVEPAGGDPSRLKNIFTIPAAGGPDRQLTQGEARMDGPEFSPDGAWIYLNGQPDADRPELQICRMKPDGSAREQLTRDARSNWFPHLSPDGRWMVYLSFPPGTVGHPPDKHVILRRATPAGGEVRDLVALFGGQGTINVNSWAPDSRRFAYVAYPAK